MSCAFDDNIKTKLFVCIFASSINALQIANVQISMLKLPRHFRLCNQGWAKMMGSTLATVCKNAELKKLQ